MSGEASLLAALVCLAAAAATGLAAAASEAGVLLRFKATMADDAGALRDWTSVSNTGPCLGGHEGNWTGVYCEEGKVIKLVLQNMALSGKLDISALADLPKLHSLSLMNNSFEGSLPSLRGLSRLRSLYLAYNRLSGEVAADAFSGMDSVWAVHLEHNAFTGRIPASLAELPKLAELSLQQNGFTGALPEFKLAGKLKLNVSYNRLEGPIPASLSSADASSFAGNKGLCGSPVGVPCDSASAATTKRSSTPQLGVIVAAAVVVALAIAVALFAAFRRGRRSEDHQLGRPSSSATKKASSSGSDVDRLEQGHASSSGKRKGGSSSGSKNTEQDAKLVIVQARKERLDLQDLLKSAAEPMSSGPLRSSYKVMLPAGPIMAVKRYKEMSAMGKEEFQEHMRRLGGLSHPNLLPLVAYLFRRKEKLLVTDYISNGSLHDLLHNGKRTSDRCPQPLDWPARLRILKGVARGLLFLYRELPMLTTPHGHLRSSNVLLDDAMEPLLAEYGLSPVLNPAHAYEALAACRSPEFQRHGRTTKKSDVWNLGVLILEVLTGKDPDRDARRRRRCGESSCGGSSGSHSSNGAAELAAWAESMVREDRAEELFDEAMAVTGKAEGEMRKLLHIGLACCEPDVGERWDVAEAMKRIEELREESGGSWGDHPIAAANEGDGSFFHPTEQAK